MTRLALLLSMLFTGNLTAQPYFFFNSSPANGSYYVPGETLVALFSIYNDGSLLSMRTTEKSSSLLVPELQASVSSTAQYPPNVIVYTLTIHIPSDFSRQDSIFVLEVNSTKYGIHTAEFKAKGTSTSTVVDYVEDPVRMYPNPANNEVTLQSNSPILSVKLRDLNGRTMSLQSTYPAPQAVLDLTNIEPGIYLLEARSAGGVIRHKLVIY